MLGMLLVDSGVPSYKALSAFENWGDCMLCDSFDIKQRSAWSCCNNKQLMIDDLHSRISTVDMPDCLKTFCSVV